jgi:hypothetical protein
MTAQEAVVFLANRRRMVLLGGIAVILHGLSRSTKDYDPTTADVPQQDSPFSTFWELIFASAFESVKNEYEIRPETKSHLL